MNDFWGFVSTYKADITAFFEALVAFFKAAYANLTEENAAE